MKQIPNDNLSKLLASNIKAVEERERILNYKTDFTSEKLPKLNGVTHGKFVTDNNSQLYLVKKSARTQEVEGKGDEKHIVETTTSRSTVLLNQYRESFEEVCAARIFSFIKNKENYLPEISLCKSSFTPSNSKPYNNPKISAGLEKIYVASKIIGDTADINLDRKVINQEILKKDKESEEVLTNDLCENAVIMMILMNYDLKLDNFVINEKGVIPIDFGNARFEEKLNPDIISAIDEIRNTSAKNESNRFSSKNLKEKFTDKQSESTKKFYRENLKPKHFLEIIERVENDPEYEKNIRDLTKIYSFGTTEDKASHAEVILTRSQLLVNLKSIFLELNAREQEFQETKKIAEKETEKTQGKSEKKVKSFSNCNLRAEISKNEHFKEIAQKISDTSLVLDLSNFVCEFFEKNLEYVKNISATDERMRNNPDNQDLNDQLSTLRKSYNEYLDQFDDDNLLQNKIEEIEKKYKKCTYLGTKLWEKEKQEITNAFETVIQTARQPFFDDAKSDQEFEDSENDILFEDSETKVIVDLEEVEKFITEEQKTLETKVNELTTHLISFDLMDKISERTHNQNITPSSNPECQVGQKLDSPTTLTKGC